VSHGAEKGDAEVHRRVGAEEVGEAALALVCAGAIGNLADRVFRGSTGVVDFIDVGIGVARWPTFNIADMAVSTGAVLLAWVLWQEDREGGQATVAVSPAFATGASPDMMDDTRESR
jgi:lipoprotein signal peptidase